VTVRIINSVQCVAHNTCSRSFSCDVLKTYSTGQSVCPSGISFPCLDFSAHITRNVSTRDQRKLYTMQTFVAGVSVLRVKDSCGNIFSSGPE
jgi:hypothetical protein